MPRPDHQAQPEVTPRAHATQTSLVACGVDSSDDIVDLLADVVQDEGWRAVTHFSPASDGPTPTIDFLTQVRPQACIYAVSIVRLSAGAAQGTARV